MSPILILLFDSVLTYILLADKLWAHEVEGVRLVFPWYRRCRVSYLTRRDYQLDHAQKK